MTITNNTEVAIVISSRTGSETDTTVASQSTGKSLPVVVVFKMCVAS